MATGDELGCLGRIAKELFAATQLLRRELKLDVKERVKREITEYYCGVLNFVAHSS